MVWGYNQGQNTKKTSGESPEVFGFYPWKDKGV
jgi:hypothetical protein